MVGPQPPYPKGKADPEWSLQLAPAEAGLVVAGLSSERKLLNVLSWAGETYE